MGVKRHEAEGEIPRLAIEWMDAVSQKDVETLESLVAPEYMLQAPGIGRMTREQWLAAVSVYDIRSFEFADVPALAYGDMAVMRSRYTQKASYRGQDRSDEFLTTDVWIRRDGRWQLVTSHSSV